MDNFNYHINIYSSNIYRWHGFQHFNVDIRFISYVKWRFSIELVYGSYLFCGWKNQLFAYLWLS